MKRLTISSLMDEYQDNEFFPQGGNAADPEAVKRRVLASAKAPAKREKRMPAKRKALLAGALAAAMVVLVGAGFPQKVYQLATGTLSFTEDAISRTISYESHVSPIELEDGRLYFVLDGQRTDVTDLIDENTPYIYDAGDPEQDMVYYLILGGTPEHYGAFQWITVPNPFTSDEERFASIADDNGIVYEYAFDIVTTQNSEPYRVGVLGTGHPDWRMFSDFRDGAGVNLSDFQWLCAAAEELKIPFIDSTGETVTTIHG